MISIEDMRVLDGYEHTFKTAIENGYCRNFGSSQYRELNNVYEHLTGNRYRADMGCPHCVLRFIKELGRLYYEAKAQMQPEPNPVNDSKSEVKPLVKKNKATNNKIKTKK